MRIEPLLDILCLVDFVIIDHHIDPIEPLVRPVDSVQKFNEEEAVLAAANRVQYLPCYYIERPCEKHLLVAAGRHHLSLRSLQHPLVTDLRQQMNVQLVSKQHCLGSP